MKIAIIHPPLLQHTTRGTGSYMRNLLKGLRQHTKHEIITSEISDLPDEVDLYHFPYFDPFFLTLPIFRKKKTIVTVHDLIPIKFPTFFPRGIKGEIKWKIQKHALQTVSAILTDSKSSQEDIVSLVHFDSEKVHTIYLAPEDMFFKKRELTQKNRLRKELNLPTKFALYVGETNWNKNLPNSIRAATEAKINLVVVSKSFRERHEVYHPWKESLLEAQALAKDNPYIYPIGFSDQEDLATLYQMATALLMPSYYEGFGLPIVEAMASGCPVIASDKGSLGEICADAALLVEPGNVHEIKAALVKMHEDATIRRDMISKGSKQVEQFSWKNTVYQTEKVYQNIVHG